MDASTVQVLATTVVGVEVQDSTPVFLGVLIVHVSAGVVAVLAGALAASAGKRAGWHPRAGRSYLWALGVVAATACVLAVLRRPHDVQLLVLGVIAFGAGMVGFTARRRRRAGWVRWHILAMGGSYVVLLTAFYVDNGPQLPLWQLLPTWAFWLLPATVGTPVIVRALRRHHALGSLRPPAHERRDTAPPPSPPASTERR